MITERDIRTKCEGRLSALRTDRYSWWIHWGELARFILPRRYRWLVTPNQMNRGSAINGAIIDSTGTKAAQVLASGMMSGITSPTRPWFKLRIEGFPNDEVSPANLWLAEIEKRMMRVFQESNFYTSIATLWMDLGVFGTAPMLIYEDFENVINCVNPCAGEYYLGLDDKLRVRVFYREITQTVDQMIQWFGVEKVSPMIAAAYRTAKINGAALQQEVVICHAIEKNNGEVPERFAFYEAYWEQGSTGDTLLQKRGFYEWPAVSGRWDVVANDPYGRSPGMDALGDIKQLQQETKRKAQVIDKMANPPMTADVELKNQPASLLPGGVTYITKPNGAGFKPVYENFRPPIQELGIDIAQVQERIKNAFFNDLFLMISQLNTVRTATEIDARREEKLVMLGPVLERVQVEVLDTVIDRVFAIMSRARLLPPAPPEIQNAPINIEYVSMLAVAQRAVSTAGIERWFAQIGSLAAVHQDVLDVPDWDEAVTEYGVQLGVPPKLMNSDEKVLAIRKVRADALQKQQQMEMSLAAVKGAETLSKTDVGGGKGALEAMLGGAGGTT